MKTVYRLLLGCSILVLSAWALPAAGQGLKVISYNILEGMKTDTTPGKQLFVSWVKQQDPDVLALQECNGLTQKKLEELARSYGHPYAVVVKETGYPVGLTSKYPIVGVQKVTDNMTHGFIRATIEGYNFLVLHLNPHLYEKRREEIALVLKTLEAQTEGGRWLIMGDFNSLTPLDKARFADGHIEARQKQLKAQNPRIENLVDGERIDFLVQQRMLDAGYVDAAFRYDEEQRARNGKGVIVSNGRIDYIYISKDLDKKLLYCGSIYDDFTKKYSDHVPVQLELKK